MTLTDFILKIKTDNTFNFEHSFDLLKPADKELVLDILGGYLTAVSDFAHDKKCGFKFAFVILKSRLRMAQLNNKLL